MNIQTKTARASEKVGPIRKGNISSGKSVTQTGSEDYRSLLTNVMEPNHAFLLPRSVPTSAGVMYHQVKHNLIQDLQVSPSGYAIVRADINKLLTTCITTEATVPLEGNLHSPTLGLLSEVLDDTPVSFGNYMTVNDSRVGAFIAPIQGYKAVQPDGSLHEDSCWVYDASGVAGANITVRYINSARSAVGLFITASSYPTAGLIVAGALALVDGIPEVTLNFPAGYNGQFFLHGLAYAGANRWDTVFPLGEWTQNIQPKVNTYSLWDLLGNVLGASISQSQYLAAAKYAITGLSALVQNTTATQYKSGSIVCAQLPGGTFDDLPVNASVMYDMIGSYNDPKTYSGQLNQGAHWFFAPEKIQDWFFRPVADSDGDRPYFVSAWNGVAVNDLANKLGLTITIRTNVELLTSDVSLMKFIPSPDLARLMELYVSLVAIYNPVGENPGHTAKMRNIISKIMASPYTKDALNAMVRAGTKLIPLALAAI